jgi:hypothetical protein
MRFDEMPIIPANNIFREFRIGRQAGTTRLLDLAAENRITPVMTPTREILLTPRDGRVLVKALARSTLD